MRDTRFIYLLVALLVFLLGAPTLALFTSARMVPVFYTAALVIGVWSLLGIGRWFTLGAGLVGVGLILAVINLFLALPLYNYLLMAIYFVFLTTVGVIALREVLFTRIVDVNRLVGAVCVYLIFGILFALVYYWLTAARPGAFIGMQAGGSDDVWDFLYYSFVTLTTLGDPAISPVLPMVRALAYLEAAAGQFYIAILVATLVGNYLTQRREP